MTHAQIKFLVSVFLVLAVWRIFEIPGVATAFWAFCTVGAIPGTDRELGSEVVLRGLIILFALTVFLLFRKEFIASLPKRTPRPEVALAKVAAAQTVMVQPIVSNGLRDKIVVTLTQHKDRPELARLRPLFVALCLAAAWAVHLMALAEGACRRGTAAAAQQSRRLARTAYSRVRQIAHYMYKYVSRFGRIAYRVLFRLGRAMVRAFILAWKYGEPHFRAFDRWLDLQLHANKSTAEALRLMNEASKSATGIYQKAQDVTRKLLEDK
jgi:hypothetical protein